MFTGIVESLAAVTAVEVRDDCARLTIEDALLEGTALGDSVAVNGVCLTAASVDGASITADVMLETLRRSSLGALSPGDRVNIERAATVGTLLGGHIVQGHVDGVGRVLDRQPGSAWDVVRLEIPTELCRYVVEKGSIALDGVSLTVAAVDDPVVTVSLIPETLRRTTWGTRAPGDQVNVEVDIFAKYIERLVADSVERALAGRLPGRETEES
ncbi:MAG TPA: riboflavin synthase [Mycobacteriales bacterium]|nr:riboflavin synthase [Mycobacteriales bacterium]